MSNKDPQELEDALLVDGICDRSDADVYKYMQRASPRV